MTRPAAVHPTAVVGPDVEIGPGTVVGPFAVILGPCRIGSGCWIGPHAVIGTTAEHTGEMVVPQVPDDAASMTPEELEAVLWFGGHGAGVEIGDATIVREQCTVHQGTHGPTVIGSSAFIMNRTYIAHDCRVGDEAKVGPVGSLAGHVWVGPQANVGMCAAVHQWRAVGAGAMVGMNATVVRDVAPFSLVKGSPARVARSNRHLLVQLGHSEAEIDALEARLVDGGPPPEAFAPAFAEWEAARRH